MEKKDHKPQVLFKSQQCPTREKEKYFIVETIFPSSHNEHKGGSFNSLGNAECLIDPLQKVTNDTNKLIDNKKLQFNDIWTNKITQEELFVPKSLPEANMLALNRILLNSIIKYASKLNELFVLLSQEKDNARILELSNSIIVISMALQLKMRNFLQVKGSAMKCDSTSLMPLSEVIQWFKCLNDQLQTDSVMQIKEFITFFTDFKKEISN